MVEFRGKISAPEAVRIKLVETKLREILSKHLSVCSSFALIVCCWLRAKVGQILSGISGC